MKIYFNLKDGYLDGWSTSSDSNEYHAEVENDHEVLRNPDIFKFEDGKLIKDDKRKKELLAENEKDKNKPSKEDEDEDALIELALQVAKISEGTS